MRRFLNFAYGSNMSLARLRARTPSAKPLGVAELAGHALRWHKRSVDGSGKCDVVEEEASVWGVLYSIDAAEKPRLDAAEGLHMGYAECYVDVVVAERGPVTAQVYHATDVVRTLRPYHWYKAYVLAGAREHGLPAEYVAALEAVESISDPDTDRAARHRAALEEMAR